MLQRGLWDPTSKQSNYLQEEEKYPAVEPLLNTPQFPVFKCSTVKNINIQTMQVSARFTSDTIIKGILPCCVYTEECTNIILLKAVKHTRRNTHTYTDDLLSSLSCRHSDLIFHFTASMSFTYQSRRCCSTEYICVCSYIHAYLPTYIHNRCRRNKKSGVDIMNFIIS